VNVRLAGWTVFVLLFAALNYASRASSGTPDRNILYRYGTAASGLIQYALILGIMLLIARGLSKRWAFALRRPRSWPRALGLGAAILVAIYVVSAVLNPFLHPGKEQGLTPTGWQPAHAGAFAANFFVVCVVAPFVEEITFRGMGYTLLARFGVWPAIVLTGVAFGLAHGLVDGLPELVLFGCMLAWLRSRTQSTYPGMLVHGTFNAIALIAAVTLGAG
jgi:membrane protease YdiL (CAAX protease family)